MHHAFKNTDWLPTSVKEVRERGWDSLDVILFTGDAYIDHPSFGSAVIGRLIEQQGLRVAIVPQPNWRDDLRDFKKLGPPNLFFGVTSGAMDSMVNHYTANKRLRSDDAYTPDGRAGQRPDYAVSTYTRILKELYPDIPVVIGGIEASLRRVTHYDYWSDTLQPGILASTKADLLVYGMGEKPLLELLRLLQKGVPFVSIKTIPQTAYLHQKDELMPKVNHWETLELASHEQCLSDKRAYASNFKVIETESNKWEANRIVQAVGDSLLVINPPYPPLEPGELDASFDLPYTRLPHPRYHKKGPIPAFEMIKFSINTHRGCFGGCTFCTISAHQGKFIASRSEDSILKEAKAITQMPYFKGYISDMGGPSANMYRMQGRDLERCKTCKRPSCVFPNICNNLNTNHTPMLNIYRKVDALPEIKRSFVGSGLRYDLLYNDHATEEEKKSQRTYMHELISKHVSGRLKIAPEHTSAKVLKTMRKPFFELFERFVKDFNAINKKEGLNQQMIPYFISSHPGCEEEDMAELAAKTKRLNFRLEQVQDFTPTPMTLATVIYYSGIHPFTGEEVFTARNQDDKRAQRMFFFWYKNEFKQKIRARLKQIGREDLLPEILEEQKNTVPHHQKYKKKAPKHSPRR